MNFLKRLINLFRTAKTIEVPVVTENSHIVDTPDFNTMKKADIVEWASSNYGANLSMRSTKSVLVKEANNLVNAK